MVYLESDRLILRTWQESDLPALIAMNQNPDVMRFFPEVWPAERSEAFFQHMISVFEKEGFCFFACELKETAAFIGFVGLGKPNFESHFTPCVEIGWRLSPQYWKRGYASEAAAAILSVAFNRHALSEIVAFTAKLNTPSQTVMQKIGMMYDPADDFIRPGIAINHPLSEHVLYRKKKSLV